MGIFKKLFGSKKEASSKPDFIKLIQSEDTNNSIIAIDNYISALCDYGNKIDVLTTPQKYFFFNQNLEREVNNGGFSQYFLNSSGDFALHTVDSLIAIGAEKTALLLKTAMSNFPEGNVPESRNERHKIFPEKDDKWDKLDEIFYQYQDDLNTLNLEYIKKHIEQF